MFTHYLTEVRVEGKTISTINKFFTSAVELGRAMIETADNLCCPGEGDDAPFGQIDDHDPEGIRIYGMRDYIGQPIDDESYGTAEERAGLVYDEYDIGSEMLEAIEKATAYDDVRFAWTHGEIA